MNVCNFFGFNFSCDELCDVIVYGWKRGCMIFVVFNIFMWVGDESIWYQVVVDVVRFGVDVLILVDFGLMVYVWEYYLELCLYVLVQVLVFNFEVINFFVEVFDVRWVVLLRILIMGDIVCIGEKVNCEIEVFVFGGFCVMVEGCCLLFFYVMGKLLNMNGVCFLVSYV